MLLIRIIDIIINAYILIIVFRVFLSWGFIPGTSRLYRWIWRLSEPALAPIRKVLLPYTIKWGLDLSPAVVILALLILRNLLVRGLILLMF